MTGAVIALLALLAWPGGGEQERALELFAQARYAEAAEAFRAVIATEGPSPERAYNLALALWRAGDLDGAEAAAEQAATLSDGRLDALRDGLLGNLRFTAARAAEEQDPQTALGLAGQARDHYLRGALRPGAPPELARNLERALALIDELEKKLEEEERKEEEQKQGDQEDQEERGDQKEQKDQDEKDQKQKDQQQEQQEQQEPQAGEQPEPQPEPQQPEPQEQPEPEPQPQEQPQQQPPPAPGEQQEGRQLTPEEKKRLMDKLDQLEKMLLQLRDRQKQARPKVERDW